MAESRELDVRPLPPARRHSEIFGAFGALGEGEAFVLVNDHDPKPLLYQFQAEHPGGFEWSVLEAGPERFRVEIRRRAGEPSRTVFEYLEHDHRRLDAMLPLVERLTDSAAYARAAQRFGEFSCGLNHHIEAEERVLFPVFERLTGATSGPTTVMRAEHVEIRQYLTTGSAALQAEDAGQFRSAVEHLAGVLSMHNMKEEQILYPMTDQAAGGPRERDDLVRRMQAV